MMGSIRNFKNISSILNKFSGRKIEECVIISSKYTVDADDFCVYYANEKGFSCKNIITGQDLDPSNIFLFGLTFEKNGPSNAIVPMVDNNDIMSFNNYLSSIPIFCQKVGSTSNVVNNDDNLFYMDNNIRKFRLVTFEDAKKVILDYADESDRMIVSSTIHCCSPKILHVNSLFMKRTDSIVPDVVEQKML